MIEAHPHGRGENVSALLGNSLGLICAPERQSLRVECPKWRSDQRYASTSALFKIFNTSSDLAS